VRIIMIAVLLLIAITLIGCGERNSPLVPSAYYHLVSEIQTPGWAQDVAVLNDTAYVADNMGGIAVIDIRNAADPAYIESWLSPRLVQIVKVAPVNRLMITYESGGNDGMKVYSIDQKQQISEGFSSGVRGLAILETTGSFWALATDISDGLVGNKYQDVQGTWLIEDAIIPFLPPFGEYRGMALVGDSLIFACLDERGVICIRIDLQVTSNLSDSIGWADTPGSATDLVYQDGYLYVADFFGGLVVIDAHDPAALTVVAQVIPRGASRCTKVIVDGDIAAVLDDFDGIYAFDISVPTAPADIELIALPEPSGLAFSGGRLLATDEDRGLLIFQP